MSQQLPTTVTAPDEPAAASPSLLWLARWKRPAFGNDCSDNLFQTANTLYPHYADQRSRIVFMVNKDKVELSSQIRKVAQCTGGGFGPVCDPLKHKLPKFKTRACEVFTQHIQNI